MDTEYNKTQKNRKAFLLLIALGIFGFVCFKFTKINVNASSNDKATISTTDNTNIVETISDTTPMFLSVSNNELTDISPQQKSGSVLGSSTQCGSAQNKYEADSACTRNSNVSVDASGYVSSEAKIDIISIEVPVRLLSGIASVKDSNAKITKDNPYYAPAGGVVKDNMVEINTAPGELHDEVKTNVLDNAIKQQAYSTKFTVSTSGKEQSGNVIVDRYATNDCGATCDNEANSNPDKSNKAANFLKKVYYTYPNQLAEEQVPDQIEIIGKCDNSEKMEVDTNTATDCFNLWTAIKGTFGSLFPSSDWTQCANGGEGCVKAEDIAIKISPMFEETNSYTTTRNKIAMDPSSSKDYKPVYVVTNCQALVGGKTTSVKCLWDMSYLFDERKVAEFDDVGGSDTPTLDQYKNFLENESSTLNLADTLPM